ncbi:uncharacterized protein ColSpa_06876 [Colletotrichum spaethianum]|uniref:Uncharacterized protein n=1 Tax=Colletotrichum spaethianum TaxID=700344 RepID=A0AA37LHK7_9PEZI|nr:uncharacterized protein ColSpa_06876 [Colletotrichum spaethianum]GKT46695.1 hypothetical protein ColSpa_06876 [Colletotrichum spaethianum]
MAVQSGLSRKKKRRISSGENQQAERSVPNQSESSAQQDLASMQRTEAKAGPAMDGKGKRRKMRRTASQGLSAIHPREPSYGSPLLHQRATRRLVSTPHSPARAGSWA